jgi:hypothetical protein
MTAIQFANQRGLRLLDGVGSANSAPTGTDGVSLDDLRDSHGNLPRFGTIVLRATDDGGAASATFRLWFKFPGFAGWCPAGKGTDADKGKLNDGAAIGEVTGSQLRHAELVQLTGHATRVYLELLAPANFGVADAYLLVDKSVELS